MKRGFTLIEMLVASLLMGMLISILTMVFNSSSIAWRTGQAGLAEMNQLRRRVAFWQKAADDVLPSVSSASDSELGMIVGAFNFEKEGSSGSDGLRACALLTQSYGSSEATSAERDRLQNARSKFSNLSSSSYSSRYGWHLLSGSDLKNVDSAGGRSFVVGVRSLGPDGIADTDDDITTWPENMK